MRISARWTSVLAVAALIALPTAAAAQARQDTMADGATKQRLSEAREALSQLTAMPEAARLLGEPRAQVSQLISTFNELITAQGEWRTAYAKVDATLATLLGPDNADPPPASGITGAVGTSGTPAIQLDAPIRAKLVEFRAHLKAFARAAATTPPPSTASATRAEADKHLDAISAILDSSPSGALTSAQTAALKKHVAELRQLIQQK